MLNNNSLQRGYSFLPSKVFLLISYETSFFSTNLIFLKATLEFSVQEMGHALIKEIELF